MDDDSRLSKNVFEGLNITENIENYILYYKHVSNKNSNNNNIISQIVQEECKCHYNDDKVMMDIEERKDDLSNNISVHCKKCNDKISPVWWKRKDFLEMVDELVDEEFEEKEDEEDKTKKNDLSFVKEKAKKECNDLIYKFLSNNHLNSDDISPNNVDKQNNIPLTPDKSLYCHKCYWQMKENVIDQLTKYDE